MKRSEADFGPKTSGGEGVRHVCCPMGRLRHPPPSTASNFSARQPLARIATPNPRDDPGHNRAICRALPYLLPFAGPGEAAAGHDRAICRALPYLLPFAGPGEAAAGHDRAICRALPYLLPFAGPGEAAAGHNRAICRALPYLRSSLAQRSVRDSVQT